MDVKSAFLNGDLQEEVYMTQPPCFEIEGQEHKVCKLIKALYGLKQAPRAWYANMDEYLMKVGFQRSESNDTLYVRKQGKYLEPRDSHWNATKRVLQYIQGTKYFGLLYTKTKNFVLGGYSDADFDGSIDDRASTLGYLMNMGSAAVSWSCKKQATVATSSIEAEYISAWETACEIVWLRRIFHDLGISQAESTSLFIDSQSDIKLAKNPFFHSKKKQVDTKYHHIRSLIAKDVLKPVYYPSEDQISDIFTKPLGKIKFTKFKDELGICYNVSLHCRNLQGKFLRQNIKRTPLTNRSQINTPVF
eukprot:PITA_07126